jgi:hypothetical protein
MGIASRALLQTRRDIRAFHPQKRHRLPHHVRTHQGTVGIVMLQERDHPCRNTDDLLRRNIHVVDFRRPELPGTRPGAVQKPTDYGTTRVRLERRIRLRDHKTLFLVSREILHIIRYTPVFHLAVGTLDKPKSLTRA